MAKGKAKGEIVVRLGTPQTKKRVTRFDADDPKAATTSQYVSREALQDAFGTDEPEEIEVVIRLPR